MDPLGPGGRSAVARVAGRSAGRRAYFFAIEIWPQEVYYLTGLLIVARAWLVFRLGAAGAGVVRLHLFPDRLTDLFVWIEQVFEGDRNRRMQLDKAPWTAGKLMRKVGKHACWIVISLLTGWGFVLYFRRRSNADPPIIDLPGQRQCLWLHGAFLGLSLYACRLRPRTGVAFICVPIRASKARCSTSIR